MSDLTSRTFAGSGGVGATLLTAAADPTAQTGLAAGTTSVNIGSFTAPSGGTAPYTASVALSQSEGSGASLSGTPPGDYTVSSLENLDECLVECTWTDADNNVTFNTCPVSVLAAAAAGLVSLVDWTSTSEAFAGGEGDYTIGGLSCRLDYRGGVGPSAFAMTNGEIVTTIAEGNSAYLRIDLGIDVSKIPYLLVFCCQNVGDDSGSNVILQVADDNTIIHNSNHFQILLGSPSDTELKQRECTASTPSFTTVNALTGLTDVTTTPTRMMLQVFGHHVQASYDQGTYALPTLDGAALANVGPNAWRGPSGSGAPGDRRFIGIQFNAGATAHIAVYKLELS